MPKRKTQRQLKRLLIMAATAAALLAGCVYPPYEGDIYDLEEQQSVWQYLKVYSIFHDRLPASPGTMTPYDMFIAINDSLGSGRYTEYLDDRPGGGVLFDPDTRFYDVVELTPSTVYFYLPEFSDTALWVFQRNLRKMSNPQYQNIIIDVGYNGGGLLSVTDAILGELMPSGTPYIRTRYRNYNSREYAGETLNEVDSTSTRNPNLLNKKIAVLMNGYSASASEILAAGLKDGAGAYLVGGRSYGKGIGQVIITRERRKRLSVTFLEISGITERTGQYHKVGILPDALSKEVKEKADALMSDIRQPHPRLRPYVQELIREYENDEDEEEYVDLLRRILALDYWELFYALGILEQGLSYDELKEALGRLGLVADDGATGGNDTDIGDGGGGIGKRRMAKPAENASDAERLRDMMARTGGMKSKWRPMGAVIVDEKDLPK